MTERMTDAQIKQWIEACNHEPAREALRELLRSREWVKGNSAADEIVNVIAELSGADTPERSEAIRRMLNTYFYDRLAQELTTEEEPVSENWSTRRPISEAPLDTAVLVYGFGYEVAHYNTALQAWVRCSDHLRIDLPKYWWPLPVMSTKEEMARPEPVEDPKPKRCEIFISFSLEGTHATIDGRIVTANEALNAIGKLGQKP